MEQPKVIGIFGCNQTDICIYLASILENMRRRVLVIDNSFEQKMRFCIPRPEREMNTVTYKDIDYRMRCAKETWRTAGYHYVIVDLGRMPDDGSRMACDELVCALHCEKSELEDYRVLIGELKRPVTLLFRDFCRSYMRAAGFLKAFSADNCFVQRRLFLPFCETDECSRLMMQFDGYRNFRSLSKEFEKALFHLCRIVSDGDCGEILNGLRRARKGECF